jgi:hypothetical protein
MWCYFQINSVRRSMALTTLERGAQHIITLISSVKSLSDVSGRETDNNDHNEYANLQGG